MKRVLSAVLAVLMVLALAPAVMAAGGKEFKVGVSVIVSHPALEDDQKGFAQALKDAGLKVKYDIQNAQGEMANAQTIAQKFKNDKMDLVHAIATPTAQAAVKAIKKNAGGLLLGHRPGERVAGENHGPFRHQRHRRLGFGSGFTPDQAL